MSRDTPREQKTPARREDASHTEIDSDTELRAVAAETTIGLSRYGADVYHLVADGDAQCSATANRVDTAAALSGIGFDHYTACGECLDPGGATGPVPNKNRCPFCERVVHFRTHLPCDGVADDDAELVTDGGQVTTPYHDLNRTQRDVLQAVARVDRADVDPSGTAIADEYQRICAEALPAGRLYPSLDALVDAGYVERGAIDGRTNSYELTAAGRAALEEQVWQLADATGATVSMPATDGGQR